MAKRYLIGFRHIRENKIALAIQSSRLGINLSEQTWFYVSLREADWPPVRIVLPHSRPTSIDQGADNPGTDCFPTRLSDP